MNLSVKIKKDRLISVGIFLVGLSSFNFYIYDPFYYPFILRIFVFVGLLLLSVCVRPKKVSIVFFLYLIFIIFYNYAGYFTHFFTQDFKSIYFSGLIFVISFALLENVENKALLSTSIDRIISFFVIINTISFFIFILFIFKFPLPHNNIELGNRGFLYENYSNLLIVCNYVTVDFGNFRLSRFNGVFEEPGMFGTYTSILLMVNIILFPHKRLRRNLLLIFGFFSASMTFYIVLCLVLLFYLNWKRIFYLSIFSFILISFGLRFLPRQTLNHINILTIDRFTFKNGQFTGNTRQHDNLKFGRYLERAQSGTIIFGNGKNTNSLNKEASYSSVYSLIYEAGLIGLLLFLMIHFYYLLFIPIKFGQYKYLILTTIPVLSIYQGRQMIDFITILYFLCFIRFFQESGIESKKIVAIAK